MVAAGSEFYINKRETASVNNLYPFAVFGVKSVRDRRGDVLLWSTTTTTTAATTPTPYPA